LTHEFGHLVGAVHSDDPTSAMHVPLSDAYAPCMYAALKPMTVGDARAILDANGQPAERCRVLSQRVVDCVGGGRWMRVSRMPGRLQQPAVDLDLSGSADLDADGV
jgi:hypothetical protein